MGTYPDLSDFTFSPIFKKEIANLSRSSLSEKRRMMVDYFQYLNSTDIDPNVSSDANFQCSITLIILLMHIMNDIQDTNKELTNTINECNKQSKENSSKLNKLCKEIQKNINQVKLNNIEFENLYKENQKLKKKLKAFEK